MDIYKNDPHSDSSREEPLLSAVEMEILRLIREGYISKEIANIRKCSPRTIEKHRSNIMKKLQLQPSQNALLVWIVQNPQCFNT
ncbi:MAG: hypothetical protein GC193_03790 [Cryomorphaceae bacterium]|nr:hypothetical protein [Cryomorphaceae bacterium]